MRRDVREIGARASKVMSDPGRLGADREDTLPVVRALITLRGERVRGRPAAVGHVCRLHRGGMGVELLESGEYFVRGPELLVEPCPLAGHRLEKMARTTAESAKKHTAPARRSSA